MSRANLQVYFPSDGTVLHGIYNGTADLAMPPLFFTANEAWDAWRVDRMADCDWSRGGGESVEVATDYGWGSQWRGTALRDRYTGPFDVYEEDVPEIRGLPLWWGGVLRAQATSALPTREDTP